MTEIHPRLLWRASAENPDAIDREKCARLVEHLRAGNRPSDFAVVARLEPQAYPPLRGQAGNLLCSLWAWARSGFKLADRLERARRRRICEVCPSGLYDAKKKRCRACGCLAKVKPWAEVEKCPRGWWRRSPS